MLEKSPAVEKLLDQYLHLSIAGKKVRCPYWRNKIKKGIWGPFGGKGKPEQIVQATLDVAKIQKVNLKKLSRKKIEDFMKKNRIPTADFNVFNYSVDAINHLKNVNYPVIIKADGLAAGKGVFICKDKDEAEDSINVIMTQTTNAISRPIGPPCGLKAIPIK